MKAKRKRWQAGLPGCVEEGMPEDTRRGKAESGQFPETWFYCAFFFSSLRCHKLCGQSRWVGSWMLGKAISQGVSSRGSHSMACLRSFRDPQEVRPVGQGAV